jgi:hypothetical protein
MRRKVSSHWLPSFIKATRPVLEILNMAGFFCDRPRTNNGNALDQRAKYFETIKTDTCRRNDHVTGEEYKEDAERVYPWDFFINY